MSVKSNSKPMKQLPPVQIDYPRPEEQVAGSPYAIRIQARIEGPVEISLDKGPWRACRPAFGYWWFDLNPTNGALGTPRPKRKHTLVARAHGGNGSPMLSPVRRFKTELAVASYT